MHDGESPRGEEIDTANPLIIAHSAGKLSLFALGAAAFVGVGLWLISQDEPSGTLTVGEMHVWGYTAIAFFGACLLIILGRLLKAGRPVLILSPEGLSDERVSPDIVPWSAIAGIDIWELKGQRIIVLKLKPGEEEKLRLTRMVRWTRGANARLGADGLSIAAQGTTMGHDKLLAAITVFSRRYGGV